MFQFILVTLAAMEIGARQSEGFKLSKTEYQTVVEPENRLTCYTCPNKGNNQQCNRWAPDRFCPAGYTVCETIHRFHPHSGRSVFVKKRCAKPTECSIDSIGCQKYRKHNKHLMECRSCCIDSYCNRGVPYNMTTVLELSLSLLRTHENSAPSCDSIWSITTLLTVLSAILR